VPNDRGSIIVGWLTKVAIALTLVGIVGFDVISVGAAKVSASDNAVNAARVGAEKYAESKGDVHRAYAAALGYAEDHGGTIDPADFLVERDGTIRVKVQKTATTLLFFRTGTTKKWTVVVGEGSIKPT
jgi:hypothetical protein